MSELALRLSVNDIAQIITLGLIAQAGIATAECKGGTIEVTTPEGYNYTVEVTFP